VHPRAGRRGRLVRCHRHHGPSDQQPVPGAQVHVAGHEPNLPHSGGVHGGDEPLRLHRSTGQPVNRIADHRVPRDVSHVGQQLLMGRAALARISRQVVVDALLPRWSKPLPARRRQSPKWRMTPKALP
jgi:hypothetical protein